MSAEDRVTDLMAALEQSVAQAKADRRACSQGCVDHDTPAEARECDRRVEGKREIAKAKEAAETARKLSPYTRKP